MIESSVRDGIARIVGEKLVLDSSHDLSLYEYDGGVDKARPDMVVFPGSAGEVAQILKLAREHKIPIVGRGAGTGLSGGAIPRAGGIVVSFARMKKIVELDFDNERAVVEPGVGNLDITLAVQANQHFYAP